MQETNTQGVQEYAQLPLTCGALVEVSVGVAGEEAEPDVKLFITMNGERFALLGDWTSLICLPSPVVLAGMSTPVALSASDVEVIDSTIWRLLTQLGYPPVAWEHVGVGDGLSSREMPDDFDIDEVLAN